MLHKFGLSRSPILRAVQIAAMVFGCACPNLFAAPVIFRVAMTEPQSFYPSDQKTGNELLHYQLVYEALGRLDANGNVIPHLAEKFDIDAVKKTITITVRKGVVFSDGTICDGNAVKWNLDKFVADSRPDIGTPQVTIDTSGNVVCKWESWRNNIFVQLASRFIISPTAYERGGATNDERKLAARSRPVGTGPFVLKDWIPSQMLVYGKNPKYRVSGKPFVDGIEIYALPDQTVAKTQFLAGDIDYITPSNSAVSKELLNSGYENIAPKTAIGGAARSLFPNSKDKIVTIGGKTVDNPLYDPDIRTAVALAVDREGLVKALSWGIDSATTQWMSPKSPYYCEEVDGIRSFDLMKAREIMKSKGYSESKLCDVSLWSTAQNADYATAVQALLKQAYFNISIKTVQFSVISQMIGMTGEGWDGMVVQLGVIDANPLNYWGAVLSEKPTQYVKGLDRTIVITKSELPAKFAAYAGRTIPELFGYAMTTDKGDSVQAIQALSYYLANKNIVIGTMALGSNSFTSKGWTGVGILGGIQWTPEEIKKTK